jgi:hypothetical protein
LQVEDTGENSTLAMIGDGRNSAALNRFLEEVLRAQKDFKWMNQGSTRRVDHERCSD